jgi:hypothetical protein
MAPTESSESVQSCSPSALVVSDIHPFWFSFVFFEMPEKERLEIRVDIQRAKYNDDRERHDCVVDFNSPVIRGQVNLSRFTEFGRVGMFVL